jgi:antagonist of KipI
VVPGADWDEFSSVAQSDFCHRRFTVSAQADRMGARLEGAKLPRKDETELLSEAVAPGTIQVAHDQLPILLLGDCQTIGGYPKIAHVITVDLPGAAQLRPNDSVRFQLVPLAEAHELFAAREKDLARFRIGLQLRRAR